MATTLDVYTHSSVIAQRQAVNLLDEQLFPNVPKKEDGSEVGREATIATN
jgi:S-adenosylmethionine/arginine decarboxylase-like enzyme